MKRVLSLISLLVPLVIVGLEMGCGGGSNPGNGGGGGGGQDAKLSISPATVTLEISQAQQFSSTLSGTYSWFVNDVPQGNTSVGTITTNGLYTAPSQLPSPNSVTIKAVSQADSSSNATASVVIAPKIVISPVNATVPAGLPYHFFATLTGTSDTRMNWSVTGTATNNGSFVAATSTGINPLCNSGCADGRFVAPTTISSISVTISAESPLAPGHKVSTTTTVTPYPQGASVPIAQMLVTGDAHLIMDPLDHLVVANWVELFDFSPSIRHYWYGIVSLNIDGSLRWKYAICPDATAQCSMPNGGAIATAADQGRIYFTVVTTTTNVGALDFSGKVVIDPTGHAIAINPTDGSYSGGSRDPARYRNGVLGLGVSQWSQVANTPWFVQVDSTGNKVQQFPIIDQAVNALGLVLGSDHIVSSGDSYLAGTYWRPGTAYVRKLSNTGSLIWEKLFADYRQPYLIEDSDGSVYVGMERLPIPGRGVAMALVKLDQDGKQLWEADWDGDIPSNDGSAPVNGVLQSPDGLIVLFGAMPEANNVLFSNSAMVAFDKSGQIVWKQKSSIANTIWTSAAFSNTGQLFAINNSDDGWAGATMLGCDTRDCAAIRRVDYVRLQ